MKVLILFFSLYLIGFSNERNQIIDLAIHAGVYSVLPTGSMEPVLNENCVLLVKTIPFQQLKIGDIILFERKDGVIVHRIIAFSDSRRYVATKGDANASSDTTYVTEENYQGVVVGIIRRDLLDPEEKVLTKPLFLIK